MSIVATGRVGHTNVASFRRTLAVVMPSLSFHPGTVKSCLVVGKLSGGRMLVLIGKHGIAKSVANGVSLGRVSVAHIGHVRILGKTTSSLCNSSTVNNMVGVVAGRPGSIMTFDDGDDCAEGGRFSRNLGLSVTRKGVKSCASCGCSRSSN